MSRQSWVQDPVTFEMVPKEKYIPVKSKAPLIQPDIEPFISPIDKTIITSRPTLRAHMKKYGVTNSADYPEDFMGKKVKEREDTLRGRTKQAKKERIDIIKNVLREQGV